VGVPSSKVRPVHCRYDVAQAPRELKPPFGVCPRNPSRRGRKAGTSHQNAALSQADRSPTQLQVPNSDQRHRWVCILFVTKRLPILADIVRRDAPAAHKRWLPPDVIEALLSRAWGITTKYSVYFKASVYGGIAASDDFKATLRWVRKALSAHVAERDKERQRVRELGAF
jgi:hypothetical protein